MAKRAKIANANRQQLTSNILPRSAAIRLKFFSVSYTKWWNTGDYKDRDAQTREEEEEEKRTHSTKRTNERIRPVHNIRFSLALLVAWQQPVAVLAVYSFGSIKQK